MITCKIDLQKLAHVCPIKKDKNGGEWMDVSNLYHGSTGAIYLDFVLWDSENDQYGNDYRVCESLSQEERQNGTKAAILGNGKIRGSKPAPYNPGRNEQRPAPRREHQQQRAGNRSDPRPAPINDAEPLDEDSIPF